MQRTDKRWSGWQGVSLVAITYVYFLIFAQFAFLKRLTDLGIAGAHLKGVMAAMAIGGIAWSLITPRVAWFSSPNLRLQAAFSVCAAAACLTLLPLGVASSRGVAFLIGSGLGLLTITLVTFLRQWLGNSNPLLKVGLGTGIGYLICNFPPLFAAEPRTQAIVSALLCLGGIGITFAAATERQVETVSPAPPTALPFIRILVCFTALIWLDSAAFFIIQTNAALKAGTWEGAAHLWSNGIVHLTAAVAGAWVLRRRGLSFIVCLAWGMLAVACLLLNSNRALLASALYPIGVSLYSVALVAYPSLLAPVTSFEQRGRQTGWIYAAAGWLGSAMGIGMGQNLGRVPVGFIITAGVLVAGPELLRMVLDRRREVTAACATLAAAFCIDRTISATHAARPVLSEIEKGRQVYISEGCINCHSQYVRPHTPDVLMWGPVRSLSELRRERPPLIGNRREGPDLSEVGGRRSALWLEAHFYHPSEVSHQSFMPSYEYLFRDSRGDNLVAYLKSLQEGGADNHLQAEESWHLSPSAMATADASDGSRLIRIYCDTCHALDGDTRKRWRSSFRRLPPDLTAGPFLHLPNINSSEQLRDRLAQIVKVGVPGTDMAGHEYLPDSEIASISLWLARNNLTKQ